jgi:mRNA interferase RelE/StbE
VIWNLAWADGAARQVARLDRVTTRRIVAAVERFAGTGHGDVKRLEGRPGEFRLRVGDWRVIFVLEPTTATMRVHRVLPRGGAYRD